MTPRYDHLDPTATHRAPPAPDGSADSFPPSSPWPSPAAWPSARPLWVSSPCPRRRAPTPLSRSLLGRRFLSRGLRLARSLRFGWGLGRSLRLGRGFRGRGCLADFAEVLPAKALRRGLITNPLRTDHHQRDQTPAPAQVRLNHPLVVVFYFFRVHQKKYPQMDLRNPRARVTG